MNKILFCGLDVDDKAFHASLVTQDGECYAFNCRPNAGALIKKCEEFQAKGYEVRACYEATYLGYSLQRDMEKGGIHCVLVAPSLIPKSAGERVKTDRLDSEKLAVYYMKGLLTPVQVPGFDQEVDRNFVRARGYMMGQLKGFRNYILALSRKMGFDFKQETGMVTHWTQSHRTWLELKVEAMENKRLQKLFSSLLLQETQMAKWIEDLDLEVEVMSKEDEYSKKADSLICYRGIDRLFAMSVITEIGDIKRFSHPRKLASYIGFDIQEYSSGGREKKFGITKMGNAYLRRTLVESCQCALSNPRVSRNLRYRRENIPAEYIEISDRCMRRLNKKSTKMLFGGKHKNKIKVACARELTGFIWESLRKAA